MDQSGRTKAGKTELELGQNIYYKTNEGNRGKVSRWVRMVR